MTEHKLTSEAFEEKLSAAVRMPEPDPAYVARLHKQLRASPPVPVSNRILQPWWRRPAFALPAIVVVALMAAFLVTGPQKVRAAVQAWLGAYIPSFGYVEDPTGVRAISAPVRQERDGGVMTVDAAFTDPDRTIVVIGESHASEPCPRPINQMENPYLTAGEARLDLDGWKASRLIFPPLPAGVDDAVLHMPWILFCDADIPDWEIPLHFEPAPPGMAMPILENDRPAEPVAVSTAVAPTILPDISLELGQVVELEDGILISGLLRWQNGETWYSLPSLEEITVLDANQYPLPVQALLPEEIYTMYPALPPNSTPWAFRVPGKDLPGPLTLSFPYLLRTINPADQNPFELDLGSDPQPGQTWTPDLTIPFGGHTLKLVEVRLEDEEGKVLAFIFETEEAVEFVAVAGAGESSIGGGGGGGTAEFGTEPGRVKTTAYLNQPVTAGKNRFTIVALQERLSGPWPLTWQAPQTQP